ncbi:hypothetical protein [Nostoc sp.]
MEERRRKAVKQRGLGGFPHKRLLNPEGLPQATTPDTEKPVRPCG